MAFSKGKRIEDETSVRIVDLAVQIGCNEGPDALTVTRICRELNCDRRVIYNRFRDIDEICMIVSGRCDDEILNSAKAAIQSNRDFYTNFVDFMRAVFTYIYEKNSYFQFFSVQYVLDENGICNEILNEMIRIIDAGKESGEVKSDVDTRLTAESIWIVLNGIVSVVNTRSSYKYQAGLDTVMYSVEAVCDKMRK